MASTGVAIPKTVTSKKGNLSIVSESLKSQAKKQVKILGGRVKNSNSADSLISENTFSDIRVDELASHVLHFGSKGNDSVCLDIQQLGSTKSESKIVRPGFSARRYLASWTKTLDEDMVNTWLNLGKLSEKTIFQTNAFLPHLRKRANDNLSEQPAPYRIVKQMLIAPGQLNEYSFIWSKKEISDDGLSRGDIQVFSENKAELVKYAELDKETQKGILSKLLIKSALNYGLTRAQQEADVSASQDGGAGNFDMVNAVRNLLDRDTDALRQEGTDGGGGGSGGSAEFSPEDERVFERIRQKRLQQEMRRQQSQNRQQQQRQQQGPDTISMQGEHFGPEFEHQEWQTRRAAQTGPYLPPIQDASFPMMTTRGLGGGSIAFQDFGGPTRQTKLPRLVEPSTTTMDDLEGDEGEMEEAKDRVAELPAFEGAVSGPMLFGSMPKARGVWGNFAQQSSGRRKRPQAQQQQQQQQQQADSGRGVQLKTADLFLGTPEVDKSPRASTAEEDEGSSGSHDLGNVRMKMRTSRKDTKNQPVHATSKREIDIRGGDLDATEFLLTHKAAEATGGGLLASASVSQLPSRTVSAMSQHTLASTESGAPLELGGKGFIAPVYRGPDGELIDVAAMNPEQLMSVLNQHAEQVAESVLQSQSAGQDIAEDVQNAIADLMTQRALGVPTQRRRAGGGIAAAFTRRSRGRPGAAPGPDASAAAAAAPAGLEPGSGISGGALRSPRGSTVAPALGEAEAAATESQGPAGAGQVLAGDDAFDSEGEEEEEDEARQQQRAEEEEAAFKEAIKAALISALVNKSAASGDAASCLAAEDIDLPDDVLETLIAGSSGLQAGDLVLADDPATGRKVISTKEMLAVSQEQLRPGQQRQFLEGTPADVQKALTDFPQNPAAAMAALEQLTSQHLPPAAEQRSSAPGSKQKSKQKAKETFKVPRVAHKDSAQSVFTGDVSREASNVGELNLPKISANLVKSTGDADQPAAAPRKIKGSKKKPPKPASSTADGASTAAAAAAAASSKPEGKKKGGGGGGKKRGGRKESAAPGVKTGGEEAGEGADNAAEEDEEEEEEAERRDGVEEASHIRVEVYSGDEEDFGQRDPTTMVADVPSGAGEEGQLQLPGEVTDEEFERQMQEQMRRLSVKEQREFRRKSEAERRRRETDRRRSEAIEKRRHDQETAERQALMEQEMEAEKLRKEEEIRERRRLEREARERAEAEEEEAERREQMAKDREHREREMFMRRLQEARRLKEEEEQRLRLEEMQRQEEEERLRKEEEARLALMEEQDRLEYLRVKAEEEERRRREEEEERQRREEQARAALEEARRLAEELAAVRLAEMSRRRFQRSLKVEQAGHDRYMTITEAFKFSYFELFKLVGMPTIKVSAAQALKASGK